MNAGRNTELPFHVLDVIIHSFLRDIENLADLPVGFTRSNPLQAFDLAIGQTHIVFIVVSHEHTQIVVANPLQWGTQAPPNASFAVAGAAAKSPMPPRRSCLTADADLEDAIVPTFQSQASIRKNMVYGVIPVQAGCYEHTAIDIQRHQIQAKHPSRRSGLTDRARAAHTLCSQA